MHSPPLFLKSMELFERAARVIPCGIYGHMSPIITVAGAFPYFAQQAKGCRYTDVDGHEYIDYMCGYGPVILGYNHPEVEEAAERQRRQGDCFNHPSARTVELAERLVELVDIADWAVFAKNGSDVTTWSIQVAREATHRKKVLCVRRAYHGAHAWCTPGHGGLIEEDRAHIHSFQWNDSEDFLRLVQQYRGQIAALIITPYHHPDFAPSILPRPEFLKTLQATCQREGIIFIVDDVRGGFRLHPGGSHRFFGFEPDMVCFSKALGNGYPIAAAVGRNTLKVAASKVFLTGSFWNNAVPMAASLACLRILERDRVVEHLKAMGERLAQGLTQLGQKHGLQVEVSGPPAIPFLTFSNETNFYRSQYFATECVAHGVFFHPHHNWFLCAAHQLEDIEATLQVADTAFARVKEKFGS